MQSKIVNCEIENDGTNFSKFNLNRADFDKINYDFDWQDLVTKTSVEGFPDKFKEVVLSSFMRFCPLKPVDPKKFFNRYKKDRKIIARKIRRFTGKIKKLEVSQNLTKIEFLNQKIKMLKDEQKQSFFEEMKNAEDRAVSPGRQKILFQIRKPIQENSYFSFCSSRWK